MNAEYEPATDRRRRWTWLKRRADKLEPYAYVLFAACSVLLVGHIFFSSMHEQTGGVWSAPLDDVFIHFDFARSTARGHPFQWSEGNGYSSGNTSITYPFVLAFGYWVGFRDLWLMLWAGIVAATSVFASLLVVPRLTRDLPRWTKYLLPVLLLSVGALDWSLFSGMEVAWFLAVWSVGLWLALEHEQSPTERLTRISWFLGLAGAVIVATRPEGATAVAALGFFAAWTVWKRTNHSWKRAAHSLVAAGLPGVLWLAVQATVNKILTGDMAAAGALVKLAIYNPYMSAQEKWDNYKFLLSYVVRRNVEYHFSARPWVGWAFVALALFALLDRRVRRYAVLLLGSSVSFLMLVALNGQVRWQNERYTMPAVAWLLLTVALGLASALSAPRSERPWDRWIGWSQSAVALAVMALFATYQYPKFKDQVWFFGRACRNIFDQHVTAGYLIRTKFRPTPHRLLVGDAGALIYASDLPGLDIIGLGGYHGLPIARSSVHGMGATVELLEHIPSSDRPDVMALYPTWWGKFPLMFGKHVTSVWVEGNVICGGAEKAIYAADWHWLGTGTKPLGLRSGERIEDELDVADILSERAHGYEFPHPHAGFVDLRVLNYGRLPQGAGKGPEQTVRAISRALAGKNLGPRDILDAGRIIPVGREESFTVRVGSGKAYSRPRLLFRGAPAGTVRLRVLIDGRVEHVVRMERAGGWVEASVPLPPSAKHTWRVIVRALGPATWTDYHVWLVVSDR